MEISFKFLFIFLFVVFLCFAELKKEVQSFDISPRGSP